MELNRRKKIAVILGARPNFIKAAPFFREAKKYPKFIFTLIHTGQHFDENMSKVFFDEMSIPRPDFQLNITGNFYTERIGNMFNDLKSILNKDHYDAVIVFGDVNSTLAGAIASIKNGCKLFHIESGLRSYDKRMPEETNRVIVDHLSDILFTTEESANINLHKEGIEESRIKLVGNIMTESINLFRDILIKDEKYKDYNFRKGEYLICTIHRQENIESKKILSKLIDTVNKVSSEYPIIFPLHPGTKNLINLYGLENRLKNIKIVDPLGYFDFMNLLFNSGGVITDSGGIQEESTHIGIPCCTLRDNTERPITVRLGTNKLFPIDKLNSETIIEHIKKVKGKKVKIPLWGDGVADRIFNIINNEI